MGCSLGCSYEHSDVRLLIQFAHMSRVNEQTEIQIKTIRYRQDAHLLMGVCLCLCGGDYSINI